MITTETNGPELYVWIWRDGKKQLLYKRWIDKGYGVVMDRQPFNAKDVQHSINIIEIIKANALYYKKQDQDVNTCTLGPTDWGAFIYIIYNLFPHRIKDSYQISFNDIKINIYKADGSARDNTCIFKDKSIIGFIDFNTDDDYYTFEKEIIKDINFSDNGILEKG